MPWSSPVLGLLSAGQWSEAAEQFVREVVWQVGAVSAGLASVSERGGIAPLYCDTLLESAWARVEPALKHWGPNDPVHVARRIHGCVHLQRLFCGERLVGALLLAAPRRRVSKESAGLAALVCSSHRASAPDGEVPGSDRRLKTLGRLAGDLAHEVRNAIQVIVGQATLLGEPGIESEMRMDSLGAISRNASRVSKLLSRFLSVGRPGGGRDRTDLAAVVADLVPFFHTLCGKRLQVDVALEPGLRAIEAEAAEVEQVLLNLLLNARDACPEQGRVTIRAANLPGERVRLSVRDDGAGIPARILPHIFDPLFTTKPVDRGTGLGLSIVRELVEGWGGRIRVRSSAGVGTTFELVVPAWTAAAEVRPPAWPADCLPLDDRRVAPGHAVLLLADLAARAEGPAGR